MQDCNKAKLMAEDPRIDLEHILVIKVTRRRNISCASEGCGELVMRITCQATE
jgi:hypothetical protein